ncbi:MAG: hypothetical protein U0W24_13675 [Bacteroidales bacterium]
MKINARSEVADKNENPDKINLENQIMNNSLVIGTSFGIEIHLISLSRFFESGFRLKFNTIKPLVYNCIKELTDCNIDLKFYEAYLNAQ